MRPFSASFIVLDCSILCKNMSLDCFECNFIIDVLILLMRLGIESPVTAPLSSWWLDAWPLFYVADTEHFLIIAEYLLKEAFDFLLLISSQCLSPFGTDLYVGNVTMHAHFSGCSLFLWPICFWSVAITWIRVLKSIVSCLLLLLLFLMLFHLSI